MTVLLFTSDDDNIGCWLSLLSYCLPLTMTILGVGSHDCPIVYLWRWQYRVLALITVLLFTSDDDNIGCWLSLLSYCLPLTMTILGVGSHDCPIVYLWRWQYWVLALITVLLFTSDDDNIGCWLSLLSYCLPLTMTILGIGSHYCPIFYLWRWQYWEKPLINVPLFTSDDDNFLSVGSHDCPIFYS